MARRWEPRPDDYEQFEAAGQEAFDFSPPRPRKKSRSRRAHALAVTHAAYKLVADLATTRSIPKDPELPLAGPNLRRFNPTAFEVTCHLTAWLIVSLIFLQVVFNAEITEINLIVFKLTNLEKTVVTGSLGCFATIMGCLALVASARWAFRAVPRSRLPSKRALRLLVVVLACAFSQVPTMLSLSQSHEAALYIARSAYQNLINAFTLPPFPSPDIRK